MRGQNVGHLGIAARCFQNGHQIYSNLILRFFFSFFVCRFVWLVVVAAVIFLFLLVVVTVVVVVLQSVAAHVSTEGSERLGAGAGQNAGATLGPSLSH